MHRTGEFLKDLKIREIKLLAYHSLARSKYNALDMADTMPDVEAPTDEMIHHAAEILRSYGLNAKSGKE